MIYDICIKLELEYNEIRDMMLADGRIGISHMQTPSYDDKRYFSGTCFPKDINALIYEMDRLGLDNQLLKAVWDINVKGRPEKDWEKLPGVISKRK